MSSVELRIPLHMYIIWLAPLSLGARRSNHSDYSHPVPNVVSTPPLHATTLQGAPSCAARRVVAQVIGWMQQRDKDTKSRATPPWRALHWRGGTCGPPSKGGLGVKRRAPHPDHLGGPSGARANSRSGWVASRISLGLVRQPCLGSGFGVGFSCEEPTSRNSSKGRDIR